MTISFLFFHYREENLPYPIPQDSLNVPGPYVIPANYNNMAYDDVLTYQPQNNNGILRQSPKNPPNPIPVEGQLLETEQTYI